MEPPHAIYNQAGPSNFAVPFAQDNRPVPHYSVGRGRGHSANRHASTFNHQVQQPFYVPGIPGSYAGYSMGMNGVTNGSMQSHIGHVQNGVPPARRLAPGLPGGNFQPPASPALHPTHVYNPHATSFSPPTAVPSSTPMYPFTHAPTHIPPYTAPFSPPVPHPLAQYQNHPNPKSPSVPPIPDHVMNPPRLVKSVQASSPKPLQASPTTLPQHRQSLPSPPVPSNATSPFLTATEPPQQEEPRPSSPSPKPVSPTSAIQTLHPSRFPSSPKITSPSFDNEPAPRQEWVISASRPEDPAAAFGITISPKAKPPSHIVRKAQEYILSVRSRASSMKLSPNERSGSTSGEDSPTDALAVPTEHVSCSTTETESRPFTAPDTFIAGSPLSTATSVSIAPDSASEKETNHDEAVEATSASTAKEIVSPDQSPSTTVKSPGPSSSVKKSWASLLRPEGSPSKTGLPISSVLGFSVPGLSANGPSSPITSGSSGQQAELRRLLETGASARSSAPQIQPRGLVNTGNMCFANAVLQTLVYTPPFYRLFTELGKYISGSDSSPTKWGGKNTPLVNATVEFFKGFVPKVKDAADDTYDDDEFSAIDSFIPSYLYDAMKEKSRFENMGGGQQEDAEEFLGFFLDTLEEELLEISNALSDGSRAIRNLADSEEGDDWMEVGKKNKPIVARSTKSVDSPITRIFGGKFRSTLRVPGQKDSVMVEDWRSLKLDIQRERVGSIEDALRYISHPQSVQMSSVTKGGAVVDASQQVLVDSLPPILVLHLKRFLYDTTARDVIKVHKQVTYGPELEIPSEAMSPARRSAHPAKYKLFSVLYHHGSSAAGGHYTLDVLHPNRNADATARPREGWIRIDDELVTDLRTEELFGKKDRDCAYLLFYRRIGGSYARARAGQL